DAGDAGVGGIDVGQVGAGDVEAGVEVAARTLARGRSLARVGAAVGLGDGPVVLRPGELSAATARVGRVDGVLAVVESVDLGRPDVLLAVELLRLLALAAVVVGPLPAVLALVGRVGIAAREQRGRVAELGERGG